MFELETILTKVELLNKHFWFASDIKEYLGCSMKFAVNLKNFVATEYGVVDVHKYEQQQAVSTDNVIKAIGGKGRLEELEILQKSVEILRMKGEN